MTDRPDIRMRQYTAREWQMVAPYRWRGVSIPIIADDRDGQPVYKGFLHDAGSIPAWLPRGIVDSEGVGLAAFVNHDYRYSYRKTCKVTRKEADKALRADLLALGMERWRANAVYYAVRSCGWWAWMRGAKHADDNGYHYAPIPPMHPREFILGAVA